MRRTTKLLVGTAAAVAGAAVAGLAGRSAVRKMRARPSPERGEPLAERPGPERRVSSFDGTMLSVNEVGPGDPPTLVFVHGFSLDMTGWHYQWKHLSKTYRCVLYDQRGHGRSDRAAGRDYSLEALGKDLGAVLQAEVPDGPAALIGHSMGGMAILAFAAQFPQEFSNRVRAVVLANTAAADVVKEALSGLGVRFSEFLAGSLSALAGSARSVSRLRSRAFAGDGNLAFLIGRLTNFGPDASPALVDHVVSVASHARPEVWSDIVAGLIEMNLSHALEHITVPTLLLAGDVDRLTPPASALAIKRRLPHARMIVLERAGHCAMLERPEQVNESISQFLREALGGPGSLVDPGTADRPAALHA